MEAGQKVILNCKLKHKHECETHEDVWVIEEAKPAGHRVGNSDCPGPWLLIRRENSEDFRWVSQVDDKHFDLSEVIETANASESRDDSLYQIERTIDVNPQ